MTFVLVFLLQFYLYVAAFRAGELSHAYPNTWEGANACLLEAFKWPYRLYQWVRSNV